MTRGLMGGNFRLIARPLWPISPRAEITATAESEQYPISLQKLTATYSLDFCTGP